MTERETTIIAFQTEGDRNKTVLERIAPAGAGTGASTIVDKLQDALRPGYQVEFDPAEAYLAGASDEDALSEADALASAHDSFGCAQPRTGTDAGLIAPTLLKK
ncbi:hypothetical protein [Massilia scottii]|uniref:hypothetical protein n=1 Tax=Massilia scottii TaxID=3057166 RepID=UPI00279665E8|nr:hypothetical protein [Massilia sp. CCM 9029]MDQ1833485.1 hypothetical protein [Massilia sp. CCM 9029]